VLATDHPAIPMVPVVAVTSASFSRPADANGYTNGDLVANSTTAASVTAMEFTNATSTAAGYGRVVRAGLSVSGALAGNWDGAMMRLWLFTGNPCATLPLVGDNGVWDNAITDNGCIGYIDIILGGAGGRLRNKRLGWGAPYETDMLFKLPAGTSLYGLIETMQTIATPGADSVFAVSLEISRVS
jgi:hypothetical protein